MRAKQILERILALCLGLTLFLTACSAAPSAGDWSAGSSGYLGLSTTGAVEPAGAAIDGYTAVAENQALRLYANEQSLAIVLEDKATGERIYGSRHDEGSSTYASWLGFMESGFAIEYFRDRSPMPVRLDAINGAPTIEFTVKDAGFDAHIRYEDLGLALMLQVRLTDDGLLAHVPAESLEETEQNRICGLYLYPFLGAVKPDEAEGYMLIPEGSGAIIDLADNNGAYKAPYQKRIYGDNLGTQKEMTSLAGKYPPKTPITILAPYYGIVYTDRELAVLATVEQGDFNAEILAYPNGAVTPYNWVTIRYIYREQYTMPLTRTSGMLASENDPYLRDVQVRFTLLTGEDADYTGMAAQYRRQLLDSGRLSPRDVSFKTRLDFLGGDTKEGLLWDTVVAMTTVEQLSEHVAELADLGLTDVLVGYTGWQSSGLTKNLGSGDFSVEKSLGSVRALEQVAEEIEERGGIFLLHQDFLHAIPDRMYNTSSDIAKSISQSIMYTRTSAYPYDQLYFHTPGRVSTLAGRFERSYGGLGVALSALPNTLFSYYSSGKTHPRGETAAVFTEVVQGLSGYIALEQPLQYLWGEMDSFLDMPLYTSNYSFIAAEIPFIPMVINGLVPYYAEYVNFEPNNRQFFLKMVEYGAYPSFILTDENPSKLTDTNSEDIYSSQYSVYRDLILSYSQELGDLYRALDGEQMLRHRLLTQDVRVIEYSGGTNIYINYGKTAYESNGLHIDPQSYLVS